LVRGTKPYCSSKLKIGKILGGYVYEKREASDKKSKRNR